MNQTFRKGHVVVSLGTFVFNFMVTFESAVWIELHYPTFLPYVPSSFWSKCMKIKGRVNNRATASVLAIGLPPKLEDECRTHGETPSVQSDGNALMPVILLLKQCVRSQLHQYVYKSDCNGVLGGVHLVRMFGFALTQFSRVLQPHQLTCGDAQRIRVTRWLSPSWIMVSDHNTYRVLCWTRQEWGIRCCLGPDYQTPCPAVQGTETTPPAASEQNNMDTLPLYNRPDIYFLPPRQLLTCMSHFVMKPFPCLSHSTNSSLALPMVSAFGLPEPASLALGEARGLQTPWLGLGLPADRPRSLGLPADGPRSLGLTGAASPLPWPTSTSSSFSHFDITAHGKTTVDGELVCIVLYLLTSWFGIACFQSVFVMRSRAERRNTTNNWQLFW